MRPLEFHMLRSQTERLVDDEIGDKRADPCDCNIGIKRECLLKRLIDAYLHQQERDQNIEHQPYHAAWMAMRQSREEIRPRD